MTSQHDPRRNVDNRMTEPPDPFAARDRQAVNRPPDRAVPPSETAGQARWTTDRLISIGDIRDLFKLGRTAAYELTHRPEFPEPVPVSSRCYRWWASEVDAYAASLRLKRSQQSVSATRGATKPNATQRATPPRRITGKVRAARNRRATS
jgi:predicted DNA-binding transcriptional regulator AlpA